MGRFSPETIEELCRLCDQDPDTEIKAVAGRRGDVIRAQKHGQVPKLRIIYKAVKQSKTPNS